MSNLGKCIYCGADGVVAIALRNRGMRNGYLCREHATNIGDHGYFTKNDKKRGELKKHGFTFGMEFECSRPTAELRAELELCDFIPTQDSTTDTEFKSPIWQSLNPLPKKFKTIECLLNEGYGAITEDEGTHFHVGHVDYINAETIQYLRRFYHSLFIPLSNIMEEYEENTEKLFGRKFSYWADSINERTDATEHRNFINLQHNHTIEFRICKFKSAEQYMGAVKFCKDATNAIINNFIKHFNDDQSDDVKVRAKVSKFKNVREYRLHKAKITANKLVELFKKYAEVNE